MGDVTLKIGKVITDLNNELHKSYGARYKGVSIFGNECNTDITPGEKLDLVLVFDQDFRIMEELGQVSDIRFRMEMTHGIGISIYPVKYNKNLNMNLVN